MPCSSETTSQNLAPIWLPHWPPWMETISRMAYLRTREGKRMRCGTHGRLMDVSARGGWVGEGRGGEGWQGRGLGWGGAGEARERIGRVGCRWRSDLTSARAEVGVGRG